MKYYLGIDMGGSSVKLIAADKDMNIAARAQYPSDESLETLTATAEKMLSEAGISAEDIVCAAAAGVGVSVLDSEFMGAPVRIFSEFESFGRGGQYLSGCDRILVVSMGTGTAFVRADGTCYTHLGGSGVGGGALNGLSALLTGASGIAEIRRLISSGNTSEVDLTVGDICKGQCGSLSADVTAANFGKKKMSQDKADITAGLANMIFQTAGIMAGLACKGTDLEKAVFVGSMTEIPEGREILRAVGVLHNMEFKVPDNGAGVYAGAMGAVLLASE